MEGRGVQGRAEQGRGRVGFRPPLTSVLPAAGVLVLGALIFPSEGIWVVVIVLSLLITIIRLRQLMVLTDDHLEVTVLRTRRIPWAEVQGFEPGSRFLGGTQIRTSGGVVRSVSPCSWWGGPAEASQIEALQREARARS